MKMLVQWPLMRFGAVGLLALASCSLPDIPLGQPEPALAPEPACFVIPRYTPGGFGWEHREAKFPQAYLPDYNSANGEEVVYIKQDIVNTFIQGSLWRMNLRTKQQQALAPTLIPTTETPVWHRNGWIAFSELGGAIWKVKANGDSLSRLTPIQASYCAGPAWSPDGRRLVYRRGGGAFADAGLCVVSAATGQLLQFVPDAQTRLAEYPLAWSPDGQRLAFVGGPGTPPQQPSLCVLDLASGTVTAVDTATFRSATHSLVWLPNGHEVLWDDDRTGLRITNVDTRQQRVIRRSCPGQSRSVTSVALAPDGRQLLVGFIDITLTSSTQLMQQRFETMNLVTGQRTGLVELE
jgi:Tol biopolymer transport system component